jgi:hypothetical protein
MCERADRAPAAEMHVMERGRDGVANETSSAGASTSVLTPNGPQASVANLSPM